MYALASAVNSITIPAITTQTAMRYRAGEKRNGSPPSSCSPPFLRKPLPPRERGLPPIRVSITRSVLVAVAAIAACLS